MSLTLTAILERFARRMGAEVCRAVRRAGVEQLDTGLCQDAGANTAAGRPRNRNREVAMLMMRSGVVSFD
jgi:hypothetical protein